MNVFEDLIGELKDENLLEDTVIEVKKGSVQVDGPATLPKSFAAGEFAFVSTAHDRPHEVDQHDDFDLVDAPEIIKPADDREFFRKRAMDEVSSLQMVEHVLAGVEREHLKMPAALYDDLDVKKALHRFLQVSGNIGSDEHAEAEFALLQETQRWHSALSARDKNVSVANIRRFCENSRPVLSSQALMSLARFYRNSSFTEDVRGKFDFVLTRLFSRDDGMEKRKLLFNRVEMIGHIKTLYANWSSITYHAPEDDRSEIELAAQRFEDLIRHFEAAESFEELLNADVFGSIRKYKEDSGELFFVPEVAATAIDCNVRLGNKFVDLVMKERNEHGAGALEEKYGFTHDLAISAATNKTLLLIELLKEGAKDSENPADSKPEFEQESFALPQSYVASRAVKNEKRSALFGVNRWLVVVTILVALTSGGVYFWADKLVGNDSTITVANELDLGGTELKTHLSTLRVSHETAYGVTQASWDSLNENEQKQFLKKVLDFAQTKGLKKVNLLNYKGKTVGYASANRLELHRPS
ncbi:MAG: hypothetical protein ACJ72Z_10335 [Pyrinomonadaceae bacterium]